jgi:hypothetical protein
MGHSMQEQGQARKGNSTDPTNSRQMTSKPAGNEHPLLRLQQTIGNQAVLRMLRSQQQSSPRPGDRSEQEAERNPAREVHAGEAASRGIAGSATPLPHLDAIQRSFGRYDVSGVESHTGAQATAANEELGASAYTMGNHVAFSGAPDLHTAAHEAAHVIQQQVGVQLQGGIGHAGDKYEQHADAVAERVTRGMSSEDLLDAYTGAADAKAHPTGSDRAGRQEALDGGGEHVSGVGKNAGHSFVTQRKSARSGGVIQMSPQTTHFGRFIDTTYNKTATGVEMHVEFEPGAVVDAKKIGMVQSIKAVGDGKPILTDPSQESRYVKSGPGEGYRTDRVTPRTNPIYGADSLGPGKGLADTAPTNAPPGTTPSPANATYELGYHYDDSGTLKQKNAWMYDAPTRAASPNSSMTFETTALAIDGAQQGTYYGSVKWGWERGADNVLKKIDFAVVSQGAPSQNFLAPASAWNNATARGTLVARNDPTQVYKMSGSSFDPDYTIAKGVKVTTSGSIGGGGVEYRVVSIVDGAKAGSSGYIKVPDLLDKGDGPATVDLPVPDVRVINADGVGLNADVEGPWRYFDNLPKGTRVVPTGDTRATPGDPVSIVLRWVEVVDGPSTGASGYVPESVLSKERP